jgi:hypothetical protein
MPPLRCTVTRSQRLARLGNLLFKTASHMLLLHLKSQWHRQQVKFPYPRLLFVAS